MREVNMLRPRIAYSVFFFFHCQVWQHDDVAHRLGPSFFVFPGRRAIPSAAAKRRHLQLQASAFLWVTCARQIRWPGIKAQGHPLPTRCSFESFVILCVCVCVCVCVLRRCVFCVDIQLRSHPCIRTWPLSMTLNSSDTPAT